MTSLCYSCCATEKVLDALKYKNFILLFVAMCCLLIINVLYQHWWILLFFCSLVFRRGWIGAISLAGSVHSLHCWSECFLLPRGAKLHKHRHQRSIWREHGAVKQTMTLVELPATAHRRQGAAVVPILRQSRVKKTGKLETMQFLVHRNYPRIPHSVLWGESATILRGPSVQALTHLIRFWSGAPDDRALSSRSRKITNSQENYKPTGNCKIIRQQSWILWDPDVTPQFFFHLYLGWVH